MARAVLCNSYLTRVTEVLQATMSCTVTGRMKDMRLMPTVMTFSF